MFRSRQRHSVVTAVMLVVIVAMAGCPGRVTVGDFVGMTQSAAETAITGAGLVVGAVAQEYSSAFPAGQVISQNPAAGTRVKTGSAVSLIVSLGVEPDKPVPDVVGKTRAQAAADIAAAGLTLGAVMEAYSATGVPVGYVISQDPAAGVSVALGSSVSLVISKGPAPRVVPNVVGRTRAQAESDIVAVGLIIGAVTEAFSDTMAIGCVLSQNPAAGSNVLVGTAVALVVSKGPEPRAVPNVVGKTRTQAEADITATGLTVGVVTQAFSDTVAVGSVISQDPAAGTCVAPGSGVALVVSKGAAPKIVPDVVGMSRAAAQSAITAIGLVVGTVTQAYSTTIPSGCIISQNPAAGISVVLGSAVALVVSKGGEPRNVPNLVGMTRVQAESAIMGAGLVVGSVTEVFSTTVLAGHVISQTPLAGASVPAGSDVALVVSKGVEPRTVPDVVGQTRASAESTITSAGLIVGFVTEAFSDTVEAGRVISQDPVAGASVPPSSAVTLVVSKGVAHKMVPDVVGMARTEAESAIVTMGLIVGVVTEMYDEEIPMGCVISQNPVAGAAVLPGAAVSLVISKGGVPRIVPDVVGMARALAESALADVGLVVGTVTETMSNTIPWGSIVSQDPAAGAMVVPGSAVALVISIGQRTAEVTRAIDGNGGDVSLGEAVLHLPAGSLAEVVSVTLARNRHGARVDVSEGEQAKSDIFTIDHSLGIPLLAGEGPFSLTLPYLSGMMAGHEANRTNVYLRVTTLDGSFRLMGTPNGNRLQVNMSALPPDSDVQVVYNPNMRRVISSVSTDKMLTQNPPWRTTRWECSYDPSLPALRQAVADVQQLPLSEVTDTIVQNVVRSRVANNARDAAKYYQSLGLREANLEVTTVDGVALMGINVGAYANGTSYSGSASSYGQLNLNADFIRDSYYTSYDTVLDVIAHELFHACFNGYELNTTVSTHGASKGFNEGLATVMGPTVDRGAISVRSSAVHLLNNYLCTPAAPYNNDDWFAYVGRRFDEGSMLYLVGHGVDGNGDANGLLEQMRLGVAGRTFATESAAHSAFRAAMQRSFLAQFGENLGDMYWDYARNRAYERNDESRLRASDGSLPRFTLNRSVFGSGAVYEHAFSADNESVSISYVNEPLLKDIPAMSTRVLFFSANGFNANLSLTFDTSGWQTDSLGNSMKIKVYKEGQDGVELASGNHEIRVSGFGPSGASSPYGSAIVLASNISLDRTYSLSMVAATSPAPADTGSLAGRVTDAATSEPLQSVSVVVRKRGTGTVGEELGTATTDWNGQFRVDQLPTGNVQIAFSRNGYVPTFQNATVAASTMTQINATLMVADTGMPTGSASGRVIDAVTGKGISGVNLALRAGILQLADTSGTVVASTTTSASGDYSFSNINAGTYTAFANKTGYAPDTFVVFFAGGLSSPGQNGDMSPAVMAGELRIVLTWGATPSDLDAHLTGPSSLGPERFHLYFPYADRNAGTPEPGYINLDLDDTLSYGPETTTIHMFYFGTYRFSVHDYGDRSSDSSLAMSNSGANVKVISDSGVREFNITPNTPATLWTVFEINGDTRTITEKNEYGFQSTPEFITKSAIEAKPLASEAPSLVYDLPEKD